LVASTSMVEPSTLTSRSMAARAAPSAIPVMEPLVEVTSSPRLGAEPVSSPHSPLPRAPVPDALSASEASAPSLAPVTLPPPRRGLRHRSPSCIRSQGPPLHFHDAAVRPDLRASPPRRPSDLVGGVHFNGGTIYPYLQVHGGKGRSVGDTGNGAVGGGNVFPKARSRTRLISTFPASPGARSRCPIGIGSKCPQLGSGNLAAPSPRAPPSLPFLHPLPGPPPSLP